MKRMLTIGLAAIMLLILVPSVAVAGNGGPVGSLTGGGQITTGNGESAYKVSFAGNAGLMEDESLVGHWQTHFHNVSVNSLDKAKFQSTSITLLEFYNGKTHLPSPDGANGVHLNALGTLNGEDGYTLDAWIADLGEPSEETDAIFLRLWWYDGVTQQLIWNTLLDFPGDAEGPSTFLTHGNLQVHVHPGID